MLQIANHIKNAFTNLLTAKLRSILTMLGVLVGTASVVALVSSGKLATEHALAQFKQLGTDLIAVGVQQKNVGINEDNKPDDLTIIQLNRAIAAIPVITDYAPFTLNFYPSYYDGHSLDVSVIGAAESFERIAKLKLKMGRFVSQLDHYSFYAVIGSRLAEKLKKFGVDNPLNKQILIGGNYFIIVGVLEDWPSNIFIPSDINNSIIVPLQTSLLLSKYAKINNIIFRFQGGRSVSEVERKIKSALVRVAPDKDLFLRSPKELIASMAKQRQTLTLLLTLIGSISLVVGGIGVMNIMLVSVIERRREIGVRMAVGAKRNDIQLLFLTEAVLLTLFGGLVGIVLGEMISYFTATFNRWEFRLYLLPIFAGFLVSVLVGVFFGFYPAYKASRLDPIETLRAE